ncbi:MAG: hypothetical protein V4618_11965 [Pseudomonadota bacterium]
MIRRVAACALGLSTVAAQAGQDVPPPRLIRPVQSPLAAAPSVAAWRDTPPVIEGWSRDRHIPVIDWLDRDAGYDDADFGDDGVSSWGDM